MRLVYWTEFIGRWTFVKDFATRLTAEEAMVWLREHGTYSDYCAIPVPDEQTA